MHLLERSRRYAQLEEWCGEPPAQALPNLQFDPAGATWTSVASMADSMRRLFDLGSIPAATLQRTIEDSYGVKIFTETLEGDQAAACVRSSFGAAVLLNGADAPWRRNFSLAHEVFHLVTWDAVELAWDRAALARVTAHSVRTPLVPDSRRIRESVKILLDRQVIAC
ncbi:MAG: hypothetical protein JWM95_2324 [Gemmatimonadetes bacterium]|nr:hypothetical protein [Gemmatimonadota bacterium]